MYMVGEKEQNFANTAIVDPDPTTLVLTVLAALANVAQISSWYDGRRNRRQSEANKARKGQNKKGKDIKDISEQLTSMENSCDSIRQRLEKLAFLLDFVQAMSVSGVPCVVLKRGHLWRAAPFRLGEVVLILHNDQFQDYRRMHMEFIGEIRRLAVNSYSIIDAMESEHITVGQDSIERLQECSDFLQRAMVSETYKSALVSLITCAVQAQGALGVLKNSLGDDDVPTNNGGPTSTLQ